jgi:hypothetical protein
LTTSFDDLIARAKAAPRPFRDVDVNLDSTVSARIAELEAELESITDPRLGDARPAALHEQIDALRAESADALVNLRVQLPRGVQGRGGESRRSS